MQAKYVEVIDEVFRNNNKNNVHRLNGDGLL